MNSSERNLRTPGLILLVSGFALLLWTLASFLSSSMAPHKHSKKDISARASTDDKVAGPLNINSPVSAPLDADHASLASLGKLTPLSDELKELESKVNTEPEDTNQRLEFADSLVKEGSRSSKVGHIIRAVEQYNILLENNPKNAQSLLALARISYESGALDNSIGYFERYLEQKPEDKLAKNDLALAELQTGKVKEAIVKLREISLEDPEYFESHLALALAYQLDDNIAESKVFAEKSLKLASNIKQKTAAETLQAALDQGSIRASLKSQEAFSSPASEIKSYFSSHKIIGPKLETISWKKDSEVHIVLKDFPIGSMPEIAKSTFIAKSQLALTEIRPKVDVLIYDKKLPSIKLQFSVGVD